jgi:hypothetical protein
VDAAAAVEEAAAPAEDTAAGPVDAAAAAVGAAAAEVDTADAAAAAAEATEDVTAAVEAAADLIAAAAMDAAAITDSAAAAAAEDAAAAGCAEDCGAASPLTASFGDAVESRADTAPTRHTLVLLAVPAWGATGGGGPDGGCGTGAAGGELVVDGVGAGTTLAAAAAAAARAFAQDEMGGTGLGVSDFAIDEAEKDMPLRFFVEGSAGFPILEDAATPLLVTWLSAPLLSAAIFATADHNSFDLMGGKGGSIHFVWVCIAALTLALADRWKSSRENLERKFAVSSVASVFGKRLKRVLSDFITEVKLLKTANAPLSAAAPATANSNRFDLEFVFGESIELGIETCGSCTNDNCMKEDETAILYTSDSNCFDEANEGSGRQRILIAAIKDPRPFFASSCMVIWVGMIRGVFRDECLQLNPRQYWRENELLKVEGDWGP